MQCVRGRVFHFFTTAILGLGVQLSAAQAADIELRKKELAHKSDGYVYGYDYTVVNNTGGTVCVSPHLGPQRRNVNPSFSPGSTFTIAPYQSMNVGFVMVEDEAESWTSDMKVDWRPC